ncbi:MAG: cupin domain-containing protein [Thiovulaceae bacterium]|jgi:cupin 2 domain-containing protein|nr:cupin domain-containing protein [Sulfurimonadaceae bacterium]
MKTTNIYQNIPPKSAEEFFETLFQNPTIKIERIVSRGHASPKEGWYDQAKDEWVIVLEGEAVLSFEMREDVRLQKGDYYYIPARLKHKVSWTTPHQETIWLACFF